LVVAEGVSLEVPKAVCCGTKLSGCCGRVGGVGRSSSPLRWCLVVVKAGVGSFDSRLTEWVPPVGGATEWAHQHLGGAGNWSCRGARLVREGARVVLRSKQPRRSQAAEETRGPQGGRAQETRQRAPTRKLSRSAGRECRAFASAIRGLVLDAAVSLCRSRAQLGPWVYPKPTTEQLAGSRPLVVLPHSGNICQDTLASGLALLGTSRDLELSAVLQRAYLSPIGGVLPWSRPGCCSSCLGRRGRWVACVRSYWVGSICS
jgi:hypothetical protein